MVITGFFRSRFKLIGALSCVVLLAACGGGGGGGGKKSTSSSVVANSSSSSVAPDITPDAFSFTPVTGAPINASITSTSITISGINTASPISITGGQYSIAGGDLTSEAGTITNGQTVTVTLLTSAAVGISTEAVLSVGGVESVFVATTSNVMGGAAQGTPLNIAGVVTTLAGATRYADGVSLAAYFNFPRGITSDGSHLYVVDSWNHKVRKVVIATGEVTTLAGSGLIGSTDGTGTATSFNYPAGIASDGTHLYVADNRNHKIRQIVIATGEVTTLAGSGSQGSADGTRTAASFRYPEGITSDGTYLYVVDQGNHKIRKIMIATGEVTTLAGSGSSGSADGIGTAASFNFPYGITKDGAHLYVADGSNHKIRKIALTTGEVTTLAGSGSLGSTDGIGTAASFREPMGMSTDGTNLYVVDSNNHKVRKIVIATGEVTTLTGSGLSGSADGSSTVASFTSPYGITSDGTDLYVTDSYNHTIRKVVVATGVVTTLAGGSRSADGTGTAASFNYPKGITGDGTHLYVADSENNKIRQIVIATGEVTTLAGSGLSGSTDGAGAAASLSYPTGITSDGTYLYVADNDNNKIRKIVIATGEVTTLAGSGSDGSADGTGVAASFRSPNGITTDGTYLYLADSNNNKIRQIVIATGEVTTLAGSGSQGDADGTGTAASFKGPIGITTDGTHLYVTDIANHKIRKIVIATGEVTTLAGSGSTGSADGTGTAASFNYPEGITTDGTYLYVADTSNHKIRQIEMATGEVITLAGSGSEGGANGTGTTASFSYPTGITTDGFVLFVVDYENHTIRKIQ